MYTRTHVPHTHVHGKYHKLRNDGGMSAINTLASAFAKKWDSVLPVPGLSGEETAFDSLEATLSSLAKNLL